MLVGLLKPSCRITCLTHKNTLFVKDIIDCSSYTVSPFAFLCIQIKFKCNWSYDTLEPIHLSNLSSRVFISIYAYGQKDKISIK